MREISDQELWELFIDTAERCGTEVISLGEESIRYHLFEEFDIGVRSFFHDDSLQRLQDAGLLPPEATPLAREIRRTWIELEARDATIEEIKTNAAWKRLFALGDALQEQIRR